ncbi:thiol S-methyltransferase TMT1A-like [Clytia hemisphaerica]|uniref:Methyltransferase type 11 domain-containing protein n=1 Tax=Clytia hemisphaerica TaxID=252671 RepID=A0A7M5VFK4_9CNID|eukprot:TCONS_00013938-protein
MNLFVDWLLNLSTNWMPSSSSTSTEWLLSLLSPVLALILVNYKRETFAGIFNRLIQRCHAYISDGMREVYNKSVIKRKEDLFQTMAKDQIFQKGKKILEIGSGSGANLEFFPKDANISLVALDSNEYCRPYLEKRLESFPNVRLDSYLIASAEDMSRIESNSIDCVLSTIVLCSVKNQKNVLREIKRVLKPGCRFYFMENVIANNGSIMSRFQNALNPVNKVILDGCNVNRETLPEIKNAGFSKVHYERFEANLEYVCAMFRPHITGYAEK